MMEAKNDEVDDDDDDSSFDDDDDWWLEELLINIYQHDPTYKCSTKALCNISCHQTLSYIAMMMFFPPSKTLNSGSLLVVSLFSHSPLFPECPSTSISCCSFDQAGVWSSYLSPLLLVMMTQFMIVSSILNYFEVIVWTLIMSWYVLWRHVFFALHIFKTISYSSPNHFQIKFKPNQQPKEEHKTIRSLKNVWKCSITFIGCDQEEKVYLEFPCAYLCRLQMELSKPSIWPVKPNEVGICFYP